MKGSIHHPSLIGFRFFVASQVVVYLGPARSGKTWELVRQYREALRRSRTDNPVRPIGVDADGQDCPSYDRALWLAPNARSAALVRGQLLRDGLDACLRPGIVTFDRLSAAILAGAGSRLRSLDALVEREVMRRVVERALAEEQLQFFAEAARRPSFLDLLAEHIRELKRRGISPPAYAKPPASRDAKPQHRELALLYADYERQLDSHGLIDREGAHAAARDALASGSCRRFKSLELVVVDGFTDFTYTQFEVVGELAKRSGQLLVSLPNDGPENQRPDLFAKVGGTLAELKRWQPQLEIRQMAARQSAWPALDFVSQNVFRHPADVAAPPAAAAESLDRLEIVAAAGDHDEIVQIARRIKRRLVSGEAQPGDIVVVFRAPAVAAPRVREVFDEFGIPHSIETGRPLISAGTVRTLLALMRLDVDDWPFRRVISVLTNNTLSALDGPGRQAADWLVRDLQVADGRGALLDRIERLAAVDVPLEELSDHARKRVEAAQVGLPIFQALSAALDELPKDATASGWIDALARFGAKLGLSPFGSRTDNPVRLPENLTVVDGQDCPSYGDDDLVAWQCIVKHFAALERLAAWLGEPARRWTRRELTRSLSETVTRESLPRDYDDVGRVRVLGAPTARSVTAKHLYLAGMSEQAFPSPERAGRLASEADYRFFARAANTSSTGEPPVATNRTQDEMLLFYEVLSRAEQSLTISYPALDDKAQDLPPSPYVMEIERTIGEADKKRVRRSRPQLSPVPQVDVPCSPAEWRVTAVAQALGEKRDEHLLAGIFQHDAAPLGSAIDAGLRIVHARAHDESFGPAEGLLTSQDARQRLAKRFGRDHQWSPSQLESYAACPYKFSMEHVLGLEPLGNLTLAVDHRRRGSLVHDVLATFHRELSKAPDDAWAALLGDKERFAVELSRRLADVMAASGLGREGIEAALLELDRREIQKWIARYHEQYAKYDAAWSSLEKPMRPAHFELRFGQRRPGDTSAEDPRSIDKAFSLDVGGEKILVTGRIDRIDVGRAGGKPVFNVIDYKSGKRPTLTAKKIESGERLQPALYVMAAQALVFDKEQAVPMWAGYWSLKNGVTTDKNYSLQCSVEGTNPSEDWSNLRPKVLATIRKFVHDIRDGNFRVFSLDHDCTSRCEFNMVCRVAQVRSLNKGAPAVES